MWKTCAKCGKIFFYRGVDYIYRIPYNKTHATMLFCSYTCFRKGCEDVGYHPRTNHSGK